MMTAMSSSLLAFDFGWACMIGICFSDDNAAKCLIVTILKFKKDIKGVKFLLASFLVINIIHNYLNKVYPCRNVQKLSWICVKLQEMKQKVPRYKVLMQKISWNMVFGDEHILMTCIPIRWFGSKGFSSELIFCMMRYYCLLIFTEVLKIWIVFIYFPTISRLYICFLFVMKWVYIQKYWKLNTTA